MISTTLMVSISFIPCCSTKTNKHWNISLFFHAISVYFKKSKNQFWNLWITTKLFQTSHDKLFELQIFS